MILAFNPSDTKRLPFVEFHRNRYTAFFFVYLRDRKNYKIDVTASAIEFFERVETFPNLVDAKNVAS